MGFTDWATDVTTDTAYAGSDFVADAGNSFMGVNADNMGWFEENAAGSKAMSATTFGLAGEGGLFSDVLMPGQGEPGDNWNNNGNENDNSDDNSSDNTDKYILYGGAAIIGAVVLREIS